MNIKNKIITIILTITLGFSFSANSFSFFGAGKEPAKATTTNFSPSRLVSVLKLIISYDSKETIDSLRRVVKFEYVKDVDFALSMLITTISMASLKDLSNTSTNKLPMIAIFHLISLGISFNMWDKIEHKIKFFSDRPNMSKFFSAFLSCMCMAFTLDVTSRGRITFDEFTKLTTIGLFTSGLSYSVLLPSIHFLTRFFIDNPRAFLGFVLLTTSVGYVLYKFFEELEEERSSFRTSINNFRSTLIVQRDNINNTNDSINTLIEHFNNMQLAHTTTNETISNIQQRINSLARQIAELMAPPPPYFLSINDGKASSSEGANRKS